MRVGIALLCAAIFATLFQSRGGIMSGVGAVSTSISSGLASAGLRIDAIDISGQAITSEATLLTTLAIDDQTSILGFDVDAARTKLMSLPAVQDVTIRKTYPNRLSVSVVEKQPVARWNHDEVSYLIDAAGENLGLSQSAYNDLPLVIGDGASDDALPMILALNGFDEIKSGLIAISRIADRRWDLIYDTGLRVQLPEAGVGQALQALAGYQRDHQILDRDLSYIDMRVEGQLVVRLTQHDAETDSQEQ